MKKNRGDDFSFPIIEASREDEYFSLVDLFASMASEDEFKAATQELIELAASFKARRLH